MEETKITSLLTIQQVAEMMHVSRQTVYAWINNGKVKPIQTPGGRLRIPEDQLIINKLEQMERVNSNVYPIRDISELEPLQTEQMGTKKKNWFGRTQKHWYWDCEGDKFLFKVGREGTGENWAEKVASELCNLLSLPHAEYDLAVYRKMRGVITPNFAPAGTGLVIGNEILGRYISDYDKTKRYKQRQHILRVVFRIISDDRIELPIGWSGFDNIDSAIDVFVGYLMLDAWIANQDRHHENWGVVFDPRDLGIHLAPTFDHASSLGRNENDTSRESRLNTRDRGRNMDNYIKRARSAFYSKPSDVKPSSTLDAFREIAKKRRDAARSWLKRLEMISSSDTRAILDRVPKEEMSDIAVEFTQKILDLNRERLLETEV